jgi:hypothetical protein
MAGLVPAIHVFEIALALDVDARHKAGHDGPSCGGLGREPDRQGFHPLVSFIIADSHQ